MAVVFSAAAAFLGLRVGQVFEAAIPIAIIAVGMGTVLGKKNMLGQNVIIQSIGASSGVIVAGAIFTLPALYILGLDAAFWQVFLSSLFGGLLGIVLLIPFRKYFVKEMHGKYPFPEATATTEVLVSGEKGGAQAKLLAVAGAVGGCQAEVGIASAMAASAAVELMGGNPQQCLDAASTVLMNMLGLVCDPVGGLVEYPCQKPQRRRCGQRPHCSRTVPERHPPADPLRPDAGGHVRRGQAPARRAARDRPWRLCRHPRRLCRLRPVQRELIFQHAAPPVWKRPAAFLRVRDRKCRPKRRGFASFCANTPKRWPG